MCLGHDVRIIPAKAVAPFRRGHKTDSNDALAVAKAARRPNIKDAPMKSIERQGLQAIQRARELLIGECIARSNHLRGILPLTGSWHVRYTLKTPYQDGTTHVIFEPEEFMAHIPVRHPFGAVFGRANRQSCRFVIARLAALVPKPRAHLTRYQGVFAPASSDRARIVPRTRATAANERGEPSISARQRALTKAQRLKRVFAIDIETCLRYGGRLRVIASIEAPAVIDRILAHLGREAPAVDPTPPSRAPPKPDRLI